MFDDDLRGFKDRLIEPLVRKLINVTPLAITLSGLAAGLMGAVFAYLGYYWGALVFWLINRSLDGLDGAIARVHDQQNDFGGYLDIMSDFIVYAAIPAAIVLGAPSQVRYLALVIMLVTFYINTASRMYLAAIIEKRIAHHPEVKTMIVMPSGLIGGFETIIFYSLFLIFPERVFPLFIILSLLIVFTVIQRFAWAKRQFSPSLQKGHKNEKQYIRPRIYSEE